MVLPAPRSESAPLVSALIPTPSGTSHARGRPSTRTRPRGTSRVIATSNVIAARADARELVVGDARTRGLEQRLAQRRVVDVPRFARQSNPFRDRGEGRDVRARAVFAGRRLDGLAAVLHAPMSIAAIDVVVLDEH